ncbi:MAG: glycosyl hydrolase family 88, partial [Rikenellaceae bacterium]|nr:glycosyl hydrolase family 88 [Rikenellaceae bacterium]
PGREDVLAILRGIYETLPEYADPVTGMWYQVLDQPGREGNYVESTASAMFVYAMLKGIRLGYLPKNRNEYAIKSYKALLDTFVEEDSEGLLNLTKCCSVAGLGGKGNRSGSYDYYINEPIVDNDPKGIGPLIWASLEFER